jgi:hypothetical protein
VTDELLGRREHLRAEIRRDAAGLREAVQDLQRAASRASPRRAVSEHPLSWLLGALVLGWIVGSRTH